MYFKLSRDYPTQIIHIIDLPRGLSWDVDTDQEEVMGLFGDIETFLEVCEDIQDELDYYDKDFNKSVLLN